MATLQEEIQAALSNTPQAFAEPQPPEADQTTSDIALALGQKDPRAPRQPDFVRDTGLFFKSALLAGTTDLLGIDPSRDVIKFRAENPVGDVFSNIIGSAPFFVAPFLLPVKALSAIPLAGRALKLGETLKAAGRPAIGRAVGEFARFLPFEAGRVALGTGLGALRGEAGEAFEDTATLAAFDLITIPITAAAMTKVFRSFPAEGNLDAAVKKLQRRVEIDTNTSRQKQLSDVVNMRVSFGDKATPEIAGLMDAAEEELKILIRRETAVGRNVRGTIFLGRMQRQNVQSLRLNSLFREDRNRSRKLFQTKILEHTGEDPSGFATITDRDAALKLFPEGFERHVQFPRVIITKDPRISQQLENTFNKSMKRFGNTWYNREVGDGGYVMAKKVVGAGSDDIFKFTGNEQYILFKTNNPELFAPKGFTRTKGLNMLNAFNPVERESVRLLRKGIKSANEVNQYNSWATSAQIVGSPKDGRGALLKAGAGLLKLLPKEQQAALEATAKELGIVGGSSARFLKAHFAPAIAQFSRDPRALRAFQMAGNAFRFANKTALEILHGKTTVAGGEHLLAGLIIPTRTLKRGQKGLVGVVKGFTADERAQLTKVFNEALTPDEALAQGMDSKIIKFISELEQLDDRFILDQNGLAEIGGTVKLKALRAHYMMSRAWAGDWRLAVKAENGALVNMAAASDRRGAFEMAERMVARAKQEGQTLSFKRDQIFRIDKFGDDIKALSQINLDDPLFQALQQVRRAPKPQTITGKRTFEKQRRGVGGFIGDLEPMTEKEIIDQMSRQIQGRQKFLAELSIDTDPILQRELRLLGEESPDLYNQVLSRINDFKGIPGPIVTAIERVIDAPLAPFLGKGAAKRISSAMNALEFQLTLGMGDLGFPLINAATFMQTQLSEVAFVLKGTPERLQHYYVYTPAKGADGLAKGSVGVLDMSKMFRQSMKEMIGMNKDAALTRDVAWAIDIGEIAPKFVEEFGGATSRQALSFKRLLQGKENFANFAKAASQVLPTLSEELARGQSFIMGRMIGRDFLGLEGRNLREFARQFTQRTMFGYGTADRPRWMAGAVGGTLGLFKNWSSHYIANMALYGGEALTRKNWAPLLWMMAGTGTIAGVGGLPGVGAADNISRFFSDQSLMDNTYEAFGMRDSSRVADGIWYGLPGLFGTALQGRAGAPGADIARDTGFLFSAAIINRAANAKIALGSAIDQWQATGENPLKTQRIRTQFARAFGPRTLYRAMQSSEERAIVSAQSGNKLLGDIDFTEKLAFIVGISPVKIDKAFTAHRDLWENQQKMTDTVQSLGTALNDAEQQRDWATVDRIWFEAGLIGITDRVIRSAKKREANQNQDLFERQFKGYQAAQKLRLLGVR